MRTVEATCTKIGYSTQAEARMMTRRQRSRPGGSKLRIYRCPFCTLWHVGNSERRRPVHK